MACVYLITNSKNGKCYVGSTKFSIEHRSWRHVYCARRNSQMFLHRAIRKYGEESFIIESLIEGISRDEAYDYETLLIGELGTHENFGGYNQCIGGRWGKTRGMFGKKHSKKTKKKMSCAQIQRFERSNGHSEQSRLKMSKTRTGLARPSTRVAIDQFDCEGNFIAVHYSFSSAADAVGGGRSHIWECCNGKRKSARGFMWKYHV